MIIPDISCTGMHETILGNTRHNACKCWRQVSRCLALKMENPDVNSIEPSDVCLELDSSDTSVGGCVV